MRFDSSCSGCRGTYWRAGSTKSGVTTHAGAKHIGCRVKCFVDEDGRETVKVFLTTGWFGEMGPERDDDILLSTWKLINGESVEMLEDNK